MGVGDPGLGAGQPVRLVVRVVLGRHLNAAQVGARRLLGDGERGEHAAVAQGPEVLLVHARGPVLEHRAVPEHVGSVEVLA